jgi:hypothetical protein
MDSSLPGGVIEKRVTPASARATATVEWPVSLTTRQRAGWGSRCWAAHHMAATQEIRNRIALYDTHTQSGIAVVGLGFLNESEIESLEGSAGRLVLS